MKKCLKCGAENQSGQQDHCPKCGVIYARYEQQLAEIRRRETLGMQFEKAMEIGERVPARFDDDEPEKDQLAYAWIDFLIWTIVVLAVAVGIVEFVACLSMWDALARFAGVSVDGKVAISLIILFIETLSVSCILAIAGGLYLGRDIANNTRASRAYLRELASRRGAMD